MQTHHAADGHPIPMWVKHPLLLIFTTLFAVIAPATSPPSLWLIRLLVGRVLEETHPLDDAAHHEKSV